MEHADKQPGLSQHFIKWTDGEHYWFLAITQVGTRLETTAPIGESNRQAYAQEWAKAFEFITYGPAKR